MVLVEGDESVEVVPRRPIGGGWWRLVVVVVVVVVAVDVKG